MTPGGGSTNDTKYPTNTDQNPMDLDESVLLMEKVTIPAFVSKIVKAHTKETFMQGHRLNIMIQPPYSKDEVRFLVGLYIQWVFMELQDGSQNVSTVLRNGTGKPIHLSRGRLIGQIMVTNAVPDATILSELEKKLAEEEGEKLACLMMEECQKLLMEVLTKNGSLGKPGEWAAKNALKAKCLFIKFHHVFCLEEGEMGCTDAVEHIIELLPGQDEPFKDSSP